jgi:hypothetical protein
MQNIIYTKLASDFMKNILSFWLAVAKNPSLYDYLDMGRGIEHRRHQFRSFWDEHFEQSKKFQEETLKGISYRSVSVFGAGNLFDLSDTIITSGAEIFCYDADSLAAKKTKKRFAHLRYEIADVTGVLDGWKQSFKNSLSRTTSLEEVAQFLLNLPATSLFSPTPTDIAISLNLLGQIPLYWRDFVLAALARVAIVKDLEAPLPSVIEAALAASCRTLQENHLTTLSASGAKKILLISDENFRYYTSSGEVLCESALYTQNPFIIKGYSAESAMRWSWEVVPLAACSEQYGERHDVIACSYVKTWV